MSKIDKKNRESSIMSRYTYFNEDTENNDNDIESFLPYNKLQSIGDIIKSKDDSDDVETPTKQLFEVSNNMNIYKIELDKLIDAPIDWNFFPKLEDKKFEELIDSIEENGLLVPLVVWDQGNGKYMILSGHNRKRAFIELLERTSDDKYSSIFCTVKGINEIDNDEAKTIIIDTNFVQRELSTSLKTKCIVEKYQNIGRKRYGSREKSAVEQIAEEYNISRTWIFTYYKLRSLIPEFMKMIDEDTISIKAGRVLSNLSKELQERIFKNYGGYLTNKRILNLDTTKKDDDIINDLIIFDTFEDKYIKITNTIPKDKKNDFIAYVDKWLKNNAV